jgi:hypothetical protein
MKKRTTCSHSQGVLIRALVASVAICLASAERSLGVSAGPVVTIGFENLFDGIGQVYEESGYEFLALGSSELRVPGGAVDRRLATRAISPNGTADGVRMRRLDGQPFNLVSLNALLRNQGETSNSIYLSSIRTDNVFVEATIPSLSTVETTFTPAAVAALADFVNLPFLVITLDGGLNPALYRNSAQIVDDIVTQLAVPEPAAASMFVLGLSAAAAYHRRTRRGAADIRGFKRLASPTDHPPR